MVGSVYPPASPHLLRLGRRRRRLRHYGPGRQRAHRLFAALPTDSHRVRLGAWHDSRGVLLWFPRLGAPEPLGWPPDGPPWAPGGDRDGRGPPGGRVAAGPARARRLARRLLGAGPPGTGAAGSDQPVAAAAPRGPRAGA